LLKERLEPRRAAAAVFLGIFIGIVPIYGFQTLVAIGLALVFRLNKPLTLASTFINNPLLQPLTVLSSVELGHLLLSGSFRPFSLPPLTGPGVRAELFAWVVGSVVLGVLVGAVGAVITAGVIHFKTPANPRLREHLRFVNRMFARCAWGDRGFVRWKLRLDRIFGLLSAENLGSGTVVDLGCGYGMALSFAACDDSGRRLVGCDLDEHRIAVGRETLRTLNADLSVADIRHFEIPPAGLILILDVLQYLPADDQLALLKRCCSALTPQGKLIFRVHDRERGLMSRLNMGFDRVLFTVKSVGRRPLMLPAAQYRSVLDDAGMQVEERRFRNRLPLAHLVFIAKNPVAEAAP
jgi:uncharacterized protein (DUF2062 family)/SAM-dependent methyltransferase